MYGINLCRNSPVSLTKQLHLAIIDLIHRGIIKEEERLPSTRELAKKLSVSRNTVNEAYELLITEGYIYSKTRTGYLVRKRLFFEYSPQICTIPKKEQIQHNNQYDFSLGLPDIHAFPFLLWNKYLKRAISLLKDEDYIYSDPQGYLPLRKEISQWLFRSRGIQVHENNIFITSGTTQAINLSLELLKSLNQTFLTENPCYYPVINALQRLSISYCSINTDRHGIFVPEIKQYKNNVCGIYVTPSHQFPNGSVLSAERRIELVNLARENNFYILEDDYDGEFRYKHEPLSPLYSLCPERVVYMGTFSKTLFPALRLGFAILPQEFHSQWKTLRNSYDRQNSVHAQAALALFIQDRKIDFHIKKMNRIYEKKLQILLSSIKKYFLCTFSFLGINAGINIALQIPQYCFNENFYKKCREHNIILTHYPCSSYQKEFVSHCETQNNILYLGYGGIKENNIAKGIEILSNLIIELEKIQ